MEVSICTHKVGPTNFEVACHPGKVKLFKEGKCSLDDTVAVMEIYSDFKSGKVPSESDLMTAFSELNKNNNITAILTKGRVQLTVAERKEEVERKKLQIIQYFHKYYVDEKNSPHPEVRIKNALESIKALNISPDIPIETQAKDLLPKLKNILILKRNEMSGLVKIPHKNIGKCQGILNSLTKITKEIYTDDGCVYEVGFLPGDFDQLINALNTATKGEYQFEDPTKSILAFIYNRERVG